MVIKDKNKKGRDYQLFAKSNGVATSVLDDYKKMVNGLINPTIIEERQLNVTQLDVFSRLMMDRIIFLGTEINSDVANIVVSQLLYLNSCENTDINIYISSPGGVIYDGLAIYDVMQYVTSPVATTCTGMAASMAAVLLCAGEHGKRSITKHGRVMIHQPMGGAYGQASDIEINYKEIKKLKDELYEIIADHSGKDIEQIRKDADRDYWMTSEEAVSYGMVDNILVRR